MNTATLSLPPNVLGFWTRCIRTPMHWSQEALAASANLTPRTIQRIEAGEPSSIATRRSLARGLGYENPDIFEDPEFIATVLKLLDGAQSQKVEDFYKQFPDHVPIAATPVKSGEVLAALAGNSEASLFHCDDEISLEAKQQAACLFDYLRDLVDVWDDISFSDRLRYTQDMEQMLRELEGLDVRVHVASRSTKMVGVHWEKEPPSALDRIVRRQMNWDNSLLPRREALDRLWLRLCGMQLVLQATICDSLAFDPFAFEEQGFGSAKIDVSRG